MSPDDTPMPAPAPDWDADDITRILPIAITPHPDDNKTTAEIPAFLMVSLLDKARGSS